MLLRRWTVFSAVLVYIKCTLCAGFIGMAGNIKKEAPYLCRVNTRETLYMVISGIRVSI
jgi:hypothetical protein